VTHHGNQHIGQHDDDGDVIKREQEKTDPFDDRRRMAAAWKTVDKLTVSIFVLVFDLNTVDTNESEH
jgi:hypothetical protein